MAPVIQKRETLAAINMFGTKVLDFFELGARNPA
jgi:hypothetical protein